MSNLKCGLEFFINEVEKLDDKTSFTMMWHNSCVIGKTVGWEIIRHSIDEQSTLLRYFGIDYKHDSYNFLFCHGNVAKFSDEQWAVIRLFTTEIGEIVTKQEWLTLAYDQLEQMK